MDELLPGSEVKNNTYPLLLTKIKEPQISSNNLPRQELINELSRGIAANRKLILLSAPVGYGKTTLLSHWIAKERDLRKGTKFVWITLDSLDNDINRFLSYLIGGINRADSEVFAQTQSFVHFHQDYSFDDVLSTFINAITNYGSRIVLVLDDFQVINGSEVIRFFKNLLDFLPSNLTLVISSRVDLPFSIARLRGSGDLLEIRIDKLKFSTDESLEFINAHTEEEISEGQIQTIIKKTEGWAASLQLFVLALGRSQDHRAFINTFSGNQNYLTDYITDEVLTSLPEEVRIFLLRTSILKFMNVDLCQKVSLMENGLKSLLFLQTNNLFIIPLDDKRIWFRYHQLFADLLQHKLKVHLAEEVCDLHNRASRWYFENGFLESAIDHALQGGDYHQAAEYLLQNLHAFWQQGRWETIRSYIARLPKNLVYSSNLLVLHYLRALCQLGDINGANQVLIDSEINNQVLPEVDEAKLHVILGTIALHEGDIPDAIIYFEKAQIKFPEKTDNWRISSLLLLGASYGWIGQLMKSTETYENAVETGKNNHQPYLALEAGFRLATNYYLLGKLTQARNGALDFIKYANQYQMDELPIVGTYWSLIGTIELQQNRINEARASNLVGLRIAESGRQVISRGYCYLSYLNYSLSIKDMSGIEEFIGKTEDLAKETKLPGFIQYWLMAAKIRVLLLSGQKNEAIKIIEGLREVLFGPIDLSKFELYVAYLRFVNGIGFENNNLVDPAEIILMIDQIKKLLSKDGLVSKLIPILILEAALYDQIEEPEQTKGLLNDALSLAKDEKIFRPFIEEEMFVQKYLPDLFQSDGRFLELFSPDELDEDRSKISPVQIPLTKREVQILTYLPTHYSEVEIASKLFLSQSTVHTHIKNIYQKLGVHSRSEAVQVARELVILK
ncbi:hypothetical protein JR338_09375 [Chloroflexota bacterium]|nr:hypothetical protein JR338_09375 [Chloroflexota bacterium]